MHVEEHRNNVRMRLGINRTQRSPGRARVEAGRRAAVAQGRPAQDWGAREGPGREVGACAWKKTCERTSRADHVVPIPAAEA